MTDKRFIYAKSLWDYLDANSITSNGNVKDLYVDIVDWQNIPFVKQQEIITRAALAGLQPE